MLSLTLILSLLLLGSAAAFSDTANASRQNSGVKSSSYRQRSLLERYFSNDQSHDLPSRKLIDQRREEWINRSTNYYFKVMREERRRNLGQVNDYDTPEYRQEFLDLAKIHYFAIRKVKNGQWHHAESIYRRIIDELQHDDEECDHAKLAVTTLLLALLTQRMNDAKKTRSVFVNFFRLVVTRHEEEEDTKCACSAKVLQAFALFEMKQGNTRKSLEIVQRAIELDPSLSPVLNWKQFQDVIQRRQK